MVSRVFHVTREKQDPHLFQNTQTCTILCTRCTEVRILVYVAVVDGSQNTFYEKTVKQQTNRVSSLKGGLCDCLVCINTYILLCLFVGGVN